MVKFDHLSRAAPGDSPATNQLQGGSLVESDGTWYFVNDTTIESQRKEASLPCYFLWRVADRGLASSADPIFGVRGSGKPEVFSVGGGRRKPLLRIMVVKARVSS